MKYNITIEETIAQNFEVDANSENAAKEIARNKYRTCEFVLEPGEIESCILSVTGTDKWEKL